MVNSGKGAPTGEGAPAGEGLRSFLKAHPQIRFIRLQWLDLSGIVRVRILPAASAQSLADGARIYGVSPSGMSMPVCGEGLKRAPEQRLMELRPDWTSLRHCGFAPAHATVACNVALQNAERPYAQCPRHCLATLLEEHATLLAGAAVGFELEFSLLDEAGSPLPDAGEAGHCWSTSAPIRGVALDVLEGIVDALSTAGIAVYHFHTEDAPLLEVTLEALPPLQAVDALVDAHETVRHIAARHRLRGTLTPRPLTTRGPFGQCHMHLSVPAAVQLPTTAEHFLAGIMQRVRALCALGLPSPESVLCVRDGIIGAAVGTWVAWGTQNRDGPVRRIDDGYWEIRIVDSTANFYLFVAAVLFSGLCGIKGEEGLELKDCRFYPSEMNDPQRQALGVRTRVPTSLTESLEALQQDRDLRHMMGEEMFYLYLRLKEKDNSAFNLLDDEERRQKFIKIY